MKADGAGRAASTLQRKKLAMSGHRDTGMGALFSSEPLAGLIYT